MLVLCCALLPGCGQKGPLYLPAETEDQTPREQLDRN
jgi:predicted small lipoprotein YifL